MLSSIHVMCTGKYIRSINFIHHKLISIRFPTLGYVGNGMLAAAVAGSVFASPPVSTIERAIRAAATTAPGMWQQLATRCEIRKKMSNLDYHSFCTYIC